MAARRARSLWLRGRYQEAEQVVDAGLADAPNAPRLLVEKTWVCCWSGRLPRGPSSRSARWMERRRPVTSSPTLAP